MSFYYTTKDQIEQAMYDNKLDSLGRPLGRIISASDGLGRQFEIFPEKQLADRITKDILHPTRYAVFINVGTCYHQRLTPYYKRYGYAQRKMFDIVHDCQEKYGKKGQEE